MKKRQDDKTLSTQRFLTVAQDKTAVLLLLSRFIPDERLGLFKKQKPVPNRDMCSYACHRNLLAVAIKDSGLTLKCFRENG